MNIKQTQIKASSHMQVRGEYRARLYDVDGNLKSDTGWKPNMVLDQGLPEMIRYTSALTNMHLGDSDAVVAEAQTGIQGTWLGSIGKGTGGGWHLGIPDYVQWTWQPHNFVGGNGTGLIKEFSMSRGSGSQSEAANNGRIRVVLDNPINKGVQDTLEIQHKLFIKPDLVMGSGTVDISGVSYDWTMLPYGLEEFWGYSGHSNNLALFGCDSASFMLQEPPVLIDPIDDQLTSDVAYGGGSSGYTAATYGGALPTFWREGHSFLNVDRLDINDPFNKMYTTTYSNFNNGSWHYRGLQWTLTKTSDGSPFIKEDTHEFRFTIRTYISRYVP